MRFFHASIAYLHLRTFAKIIYLQFFKYFGVKRFLFTLLFIVLFSAFFTVILLCRLLDEVFFFSYRNTKIEKPIFIISNPRSGTTFMHRLMCLDEEKYCYTSLYHTLLPSITLFKIIDFFGFIDKKIGSPLRKLFDYLDGFFFGGWENIHPMGFNQSEEDEGMYVFTGITPGIFLLCPYIDEIPYVKFPDKMEEHERRYLMEFYKNTLQRFMFVGQKGKTYLSKNVMSTGRLQSLLEYFPDARIIYIFRHPDASVPSLISMFSLSWKTHSPDIEENSPESRAWGQVAMDYYKYFNELKSQIPAERLITIRYEDLVENPKKTVLDIYEHFDLDVSKSFLEKLTASTKKARNYESKHEYSLEQYGMTKEEVREELKEIFEEYQIN